MCRALELARRGRGLVQPNPLVGAVLVRAGAIVGEGWHRACGGDHAEVDALRAAGAAARGATLYVTLEPCAHHGRTPPCTDAIIAAGVGRVVYAAADPNPAARGGAELLRAAGIEVLDGVERDAARVLNASFFHRIEVGTPFLALKLAVSLDGRIAAGPGERTAITGAEALRETHHLRADHDAVLVGAGTARTDDPLLTVRDVPVRTPPVRVVLDTTASLDPGARLVVTIDQAPVWLLCADDAPAHRVRALEDAGVRVITVQRAGPRVDLHAASAALGGAGVHSILVEGGGAIASALLAAGLAHRLHLFVAPIFIGARGVPAFDLDAAVPPTWRLVATRRLGADVLLTLDPAPTPVERS
jgi:diaminohydroxyphosphoribosylaminopyrimidine deaminase / 5-amino-6-(5-phosphoribosylamino)uracil reductase